MRPDHYATLGVAPAASAADIRSAYLQLMREHHPDRNPSPESAERSKEIIAAFKVLGDFDQRSYYDWDRRRDREAAEADASAHAPRRGKRAGIAVAGIGLAAMGGWLLVPDVETRRAAPTRTAAIDTETLKAAPHQKSTNRPLDTVIRIPPALPGLTGTKMADKAASGERTNDSNDPRPRLKEVAPNVDVRVAMATPRARPSEKSSLRLASTPAPPQAATAPAPLPKLIPANARPGSDIASLDQFVMNFYGQSWRYGDAPKRAVLEKTRASFLARRGACTGDSCRRNAYLDLMRDVSSIVETGKPEPR